MKSIFYIGAALMIGAGIYGFADYKKATGTKEFKSLYDSHTSVGTTEKEVLGTNKTDRVKEEPVKTENSKAVLPAISKEEFYAATKSSPRKQKTKKSKKLNYKLFSRAAMEKFEPPIVIEDEAQETDVIAEKVTDKKKQ